MMELTIRLVDVPMRVRVPPKIAAYERGNNNFVGLIWNRFDKLIANGMKIATAAVLLIKPDIIAIVNRNIKILNHFLFPVN